MMGPGFEKEVLKVVRRIPRGRVVTYRDVASAAGRPRAWRAVGRILNRNPTPVVIPCHRVVKSDGGLGGYKLGMHKKLELLLSEGIEVKKGRIDLKKFKWDF